MEGDGYSCAANGPPKLQGLVPLLVSGTISRSYVRKHGGCLWAAKAHCAHERLSGVGEPHGPTPHCKVMRPGSRTFPPVISLHLCFSSWNSFPRFHFSKHQSTGEPPEGLLRWEHHHSPPPSVSILQLWHVHHATKNIPLQRAQGTQPSVDYQQDIPHPTLNPGNPREAFRDCFTGRCWNGIRGSFLRGSYFPLFKLDKLHLAC